jgi:predicted metal-binding membrane protein
VRRTLIESVLRDTRTPVVVFLGLAVIVSWAWIVVLARDMYGPMTGASAWMMTPEWRARHVLLLWLMWAVMMAGMMLPSATPTLLLYATAARQRQMERATSRTYLLALGYLTVWALFSAGATALQRLLASRLILSPMMELVSPRASAAVLLLAGLYQLTPLKRACLTVCQSPLGFLMRRWRPGAFGAFRMGLDSGLYCLGCCWALMLLLFVGGVMNLTMILALTAFVALEKLAPVGPQGARVSGALLVALAVWVFLR